MKKNTPVNEYMAHLPIELESSQSLTEAIQVMRDNGIRHIPIMKSAKVLGIISDRDIKFAIAVLGNQTDIKIEDICISEYISVSPLTPVKKVAEEMYKSKVGSVLIKDGETLVGIFTTTDALKVLAEC